MQIRSFGVAMRPAAFQASAGVAIIYIVAALTPELLFPSPRCSGTPAADRIKWVELTVFDLD